MPENPKFIAVHVVKADSVSCLVLKMMKLCIYTILVLSLSGLIRSDGAVPRMLGSVHLSSAAFVEAYIDQGDEASFIGDRYTLYVSTFNPINGFPDPKYMLRGLGRQFKNVSNWDLEVIDRTAQWPNNPDQVPFEVFNTSAICWTSGFLVPPKTHGRLQIYDTSKNPLGEPVNIAAKDGGNNWSYHRVIWKDIDFDGDLDALTARFNKPIIGITRKQLVWMENPGLPLENSTTDGWTQHIIKDGGTDVHFRMANLTVNGTLSECIISAEFFNEKLMLYCSGNGNWSDWDHVSEVPIDTTTGQTFDVYYHDFNQDGRPDILISAYNHSRGNVFVYETPLDVATGNFTKHTIADGFKANLIIGGQSMTPGSPKPFYPTKEYEETVLPGGRHVKAKFSKQSNIIIKRKPYIMLSGDDDGRHYILEPVSDDAIDWTYNKHILVDTNRTTSGKFAVGDFDGDSFTDIVVAGYTSGTLYAFTI